MQSILAELWNGNICPLEHSGKNNPQIQDLMVLLERNGEKLNSSLNEDARKTFENYICCVEELLSLNTEQAFCDGFCLASRVLTEALSTEIH